MAKIDDLKTNANKSKVVNMSTPMNSSRNATKKPKTVIGPVSSQSQASNSSDRISFDLTSMPKKVDPSDESIHESPVTDILSGPDSPFAKYVANEVREMNTYLDDYEDEKEAEGEIAFPDDPESGRPKDIMQNATLMEDETFDDDIEVEEEDNNMEINQRNNVTEPEKVQSVMDEEPEISIEDDVNDGIRISEDDIESYSDDFDFEEEDEEEPARDESYDELDIDTEPDDIEEEVKEESVADEPADITISADELEINTSSTPSTYEYDLMMDEDEEETPSVTKSTDDSLKELQRMATEKFKPISKKLDISSFTIARKPTSKSKAVQNKNIRIAKWVAPSQGTIILMREYLGSELESLRELSENANSMISLNRKYNSVYDHIASPKPSSYEAWAKCTPFSDIDHYFFAIYIANFKGVNYLPADCENKVCKTTYLTDDVPVLDMVKFDTEENKKKFMHIYKDEIQPSAVGLYVTEAVPISNQIAIAFKEPTLADIIDIVGLDQRFRDQHSTIIDYIPYMDKLYYIDIANQTLTPFEFKTYDTPVKTAKSKVQTYDKILKSLDVDEFGLIKSYARAIAERNSGVSYIYPESECPKCHHTITEKAATAEELLFTRYQLGALVNTSLD